MRDDRDPAVTPGPENAGADGRRLPRPSGGAKRTRLATDKRN